VKLVVEETHSAALEAYLPSGDPFATSRLALVEVSRAVALADTSDAGQEESERLLASCLLVEVSDRLLREAASLASRHIRTLDAIHLASALHVDADELIAYDHRLLAGASQHGLPATAPGLA